MNDEQDSVVAIWSLKSVYKDGIKQMKYSDLIKDIINRYHTEPDRDPMWFGAKY